MQKNTLKNHYSSYIAIAMVNLGPLLGVLLGNWTPFEVVFIYWFENFIIGLFVIARMIYKPQGGLAFAIGGAILSLFFLLHYGFFCWGQGWFIFTLLGDAVPQFNNQAVFSSAIEYVFSDSLRWVGLSMLLAHLIRYIQDYMAENIDSARSEMRKPYRRLIVLHIVILVGGTFAFYMPSGAFAIMLMLIVFKIFSDMKSDQFEREEQMNKQGSMHMVDQIIAQLEDEGLNNNAQASMSINGKTMNFASYTELRDSVKFQQMKTMARWFMSKRDIERLEEALENRIAKEEGHSGVILDGEVERVVDDIKVISLENMTNQNDQ